MNTVITPNALVRSGFRKITLGELRNTECDEVCIFDFPSPDPIDEDNGDGRLRDVWDYAIDLSWISVNGKEVPATADTEIWVR